MRKVWLVLALFGVLAFLACDQAWGNEWSKAYGGISSDRGRCVYPTSDGGYVVVGTTNSFSSSDDVWLLKLSANGTVEWAKSYGGSGTEEGYAVQQTSDGGYIVAGLTFVSSSYHVWVLKLSETGAIEWEKILEKTGSFTKPLSIQETEDGGFVLATYTYSAGTSNDVLVMKLTATGSVEWERKFGTSNYDIAQAIHQTSDGGYVVAGYTAWPTGWTQKVFLLKLAANGTLQWVRAYENGSNSYLAYSVRQTSDGGYIVAGEINNNGGAWVAKFTDNGTIEWSRRYGNGEATDVKQTPDGGFIVVGNDVGDAFLLKLDRLGNVEWARMLGGSGAFASASGFSVQLTSDGGYVVAGMTNAFGAGGSDVWVIKVDASGSIAGCFYLVDRSVSASNEPLSPLDLGSNFSSTIVTSISDSLGISPQDTSVTETLRCRSVTYELMLSVTGSGVVTSTPSGLSCPEGCTARFNKDTEVRLTAQPEDGWTFAGWGGDCASCGQADTCILHMLADRNCTAEFEVLGPVDRDTDGVPDSEEAEIGDGNGDGMADEVQSHVASLKAADTGQGVTLASEADEPLREVQAIPVTEVKDRPARVVFPYGFFRFKVEAVGTGAEAQMRVYLPYDPRIQGYWKKNVRTGAWENIAVGVRHDARQGKTIVEFALRDGGPFDEDGGSNGEILDVGGPGYEVEAVPAIEGWRVWFVVLGTMALGLWWMRRHRTLGSQ